MMSMSLNSLRILSESAARIRRSPMTQIAKSHFALRYQRGHQSCWRLPPTMTVIEVIRTRFLQTTHNTSPFPLIAPGIVHRHPAPDLSLPMNSVLRHTHNHVPAMSARLLRSRSSCSPSSMLNCIGWYPGVQRMALTGWKMWMRILYWRLWKHLPTFVGNQRSVKRHLMCGWTGQYLTFLRDLTIFTPLIECQGECTLSCLLKNCKQPIPRIMFLSSPAAFVRMHVLCCISSPSIAHSLHFATFSVYMLFCSTRALPGLAVQSCTISMTQVTFGRPSRHQINF